MIGSFLESVQAESVCTHCRSVRALRGGAKTPAAFDGGILPEGAAKFSYAPDETC
jgi:hypothetical protein